MKPKPKTTQILLDKKEAPLERPETFVEIATRVKWGENNQPLPPQVMIKDRYLIQLWIKRAGKEKGILGLTMQQMEEYAEMMRGKQQPEQAK